VPLKVIHSSFLRLILIKPFIQRLLLCKSLVQVFILQKSRGFYQNLKELLKILNTLLLVYPHKYIYYTSLSFYLKLGFAYPSIEICNLQGLMKILRVRKNNKPDKMVKSLINLMVIIFSPIGQKVVMHHHTFFSLNWELLQQNLNRCLTIHFQHRDIYILSMYGRQNKNLFVKF
jgi:hypothetical protein